ncbi:MAG TPA: enoyl-CoA hydratase/isomerase family protein [Vicinamibacterales bacterium]|nr:enoyl-CoA hydratase/isomerase family protein [Vicinamibacterales bacterium]
MTSPPLVRAEYPRDGWVRLVLDRPPANILTMAMCDGLMDGLTAARALPGTRLVSIEGEGAHFSYGASVEEHAPERVGEMLPAFHELVGALLDAPFATAAVVRGRCFGGGLEVVLACDLVFASNDAQMGVPEIALGVFPPAASALLPLRVGAARASRVVLTGAAMPADWWDSAGLLTEVGPADELGAALLGWFGRYLEPRSAVAVRHAALAGRTLLRQHARETLRTLERQYLDELMLSHDAVEGCAAFLEKRAPAWRNQ